MSVRAASLPPQQRLLCISGVSLGSARQVVRRSTAWILSLLLLFSQPHCLLAAEVDPLALRSAPQGRFESVDIWLDSGASPLAAYQLEVTFSSRAIKLVGVEGGDAPAFRDPPHFDPRALQRDRVVLAAFSLRPPLQLPVGSARIARLQVFVPAHVSAEARITLVTASDPERRILAAKPVLKLLSRL